MVSYTVYTNTRSRDVLCDNMYYNIVLIMVTSFATIYKDVILHNMG
jgi:hypothetical protein